MWRSFVEVGNVSQSRVTDNRQTRYRMGIKYTW
ncbi:oligogalacturonate-specific porin KdgM family protein [Photobacterium carnosum]|nr:oligogalacturonate-specific porin KdgM family protein [Photobacterium carnosum]